MISRVSKNNKFLSHVDPLKLSCHSLKFLAKEFLDVDHVAFSQVTDGVNIRLADRGRVLQYNEMDAMLTLRLYQEFRKLLSPDEWGYIDDVETPQLLNLLHMNWRGIPYDTVGAKTFLEKADSYLLELERKIFKLTGRTFNLSSQKELKTALFYNPRVAQSDGNVLKPVFVSESGNVKVDSDSLLALKRSVETKERLLPEETRTSKAAEMIGLLIEHSELRKATTMVESHLGFAVRSEDGYRILPSITAEAKSGRVKTAKPNLLGLPKAIFKKGKADAKSLFGISSVRNLIKAPDDYVLLSIDINALDLTVLADYAAGFNPQFPWLDFFRKKNGRMIDIHLAVWEHTDRETFRNSFTPFSNQFNEGDHIANYWPSKLGENEVTLINRETNRVKTLAYPDPSLYQKLNKSRKVAKEINLSTSYLMGAKEAALKLKKATGDHFSSDDAKARLGKFYSAFPAIRDAQDEVGNSIYQQGFVQSQFGRKYFADVFDDFNECFHSTPSPGQKGSYEFICYINGSFWYLAARDWIKEPLPVIENLKPVPKPFGFRFSKIEQIERLEKYLFRKSGRKARTSKFNRKSEGNQDEVSDLAMSRIALTQAIDSQLALGSSRTEEAERILDRFVDNGNYLIPEKNIAFYRVLLRNPASQYFKKYSKLNKVIRKFFPMYCQGVAATLAAKCLTEVREKIESGAVDAQLLLFVHDQIDVLVRKDQVGLMKTILIAAIESEKKPFKVMLTGKIEPEEGSSHYI